MIPEADIQLGNGGLSGLINALGLKPYGEELFIGKARGFPLGLKFFDSQETILVLLQIRYPFNAVAKSGRSLNYASNVNDLIQTKKMEVSLEDKIAWITIPDAGPLIEKNTLSQVIDSILISLGNAGFAGDSDKCHYCQLQTVDRLVCVNGKVAQICEKCVEANIKSQAVERSLSAAGITKVFSLGILASGVGALAWVVVWIVYDGVFQTLHTDRIFIPRIFVIVPLTIVAASVGGPVGFIIRRIPKRGDLMAGFAGIVFGIASITMGEVLYITWLIYKEYKVVSFSAAIAVLPQCLLQGGWEYLAIKGTAALVSVFLAYQLSRPKTTRLKL